MITFLTTLSSYLFLPSRQVLLYFSSIFSYLPVRCYCMFHHRLPQEPLAFVHVAFTTDLAASLTYVQNVHRHFCIFFAFPFFTFLIYFVVSCIYLIILFFNTFFIFHFFIFYFSFFIFHFFPAILAVPTRRLTQGARCSIA